MIDENGDLKTAGTHAFWLAILLTLATVLARGQSQNANGDRWWSDSAATALERAGTNRTQIAEALAAVPAGQREGLQFLVENMPDRDLKSLSSGFLLENVALSYRAAEETPWAKAVPKEYFLNNVLPYASVTEDRVAWRQRLHDLCAPLVKECKSPGEAAQVLNRQLFGLVKVRFSTERRTVDASPLETMASGVATCTGLSILLVDACRSVGVPARLAGTPAWVSVRGNHTWVEVWDAGWHFTGAAEPDPNGLDRGWFTHNASQALRNDPSHAIYAASFKSTGLAFPMVWARGVKYVGAENVTDRYAAKPATPSTNTFRLLVNVLDRPAGRRVAVKVTVADTGDSAVKFEGSSRGETADPNDLLPVVLPRQRTYEVSAVGEGRSVRRTFQAGTNAQEILLLCLDSVPSFYTPALTNYAPQPVIAPLDSADETRLKQAAAEYFKAASEKQDSWTFPPDLEKLLRGNEPGVRRAVWDAYRTAPIHEDLKRDYEARQVRFERHLSPYTLKTVGARPPGGWPLFIAMHGGGNAPKAVNDSQWQIMQRYYRDHPESGGYLYVALRAPDDTWNGFYTDYVYPLVENLIRQFLLFADADSNKISIMGYSHGGYGAFAIGPKMPDRFAAIHASAGAPTDGETTAKTLRNTLFTYMIGEKDTMYGRLDRCRRFEESVKLLRGGRADCYPVFMQYIPGNGHTGLPDRDKIQEMYPAVRNPAPRELSWLMTDGVIDDFYWLRSGAPGKQLEIEASCRDNRVVVTAGTNAASVVVLLDTRLVDFTKPVAFEWNGASSSCRIEPSLRVLCESIRRRGDPELAFTAQVEMPIQAK
jgi:transglutaminase-like putative cysteine protease